MIDLYHQVQAGIAYMHLVDELSATSIVASCGYEDVNLSPTCIL